MSGKEEEKGPAPIHFARDPIGACGALSQCGPTLHQKCTLHAGHAGDHFAPPHHVWPNIADLQNASPVSPDSASEGDPDAASTGRKDSAAGGHGAQGDPAPRTNNRHETPAAAPSFSGSASDGAQGAPTPPHGDSAPKRRALNIYDDAQRIDELLARVEAIEVGLDHDAIGPRAGIVAAQAITLRAHEDTIALLACHIVSMMAGQIGPVLEPLAALYKGLAVQAYFETVDGQLTYHFSFPERRPTVKEVADFVEANKQGQAAQALRSSLLGNPGRRS